MTTKRKIIFGFLLVLLLLVAVALVGYRGLNNATTYFDRYDERAIASVNLSDLLMSISGQAYELERFMLTHSAEHSQKAIAHMREAEQFAQAVLQYLSNEGRRATIEQVIKKVQGYIPLLEGIEARARTWRQAYEKDLVPTVARLGQLITEVSNAAASADNTTALSRIVPVCLSINATATALVVFYNAPVPNNSEGLAKALADMDAPIRSLGQAMSSRGNAERNTYEAFAAEYEELKGYFKKHKETALSITDMANKTYEDDDFIISSVGAINEVFNQQMDEARELTHEGNKTSQVAMIGVSAGGIIVGLLFALFIITGIIKALNRIAAYASAVSRGAFEYRHGITEKGEIGAMVKALEEIPATLSRVISECNSVAAAIAKGSFRTRLENSQFEGGFQTLAIAVNTVSDSFTKTIDELPVSIMAANLDRRIVFLNALAQKIAGGNTTGVFCGDKLGASVCSNEDCFGKACLRSNAPAKGEVSIQTPGGTLHLSVSATPLYDRDGKAAGTMEIVTDVTQIKEQQLTMASVARQARDISDRVAAASEELSAQVEEVSRGAEMQRERVESTSTAMAEMNSTVLEVARNAGHAAEQGDDTRKNAEKGAELVNQVVAAISNVNRVAVRLQESMAGLGEQAKNIGGVMNVISDIADQTNLLALNAAIEAARAGEAGRGFAVVADEVRKLAEKTMQATQEVYTNITAIQNSTQTNISEVNDAVTGVARATELASSSGEALKGIVNIASTTSSVVTSIATAAEEQSAASDEITQSIEEINRIVSETAQGMVQSSQAVQELSQMAQELKHLLDRLK